MATFLDDTFTISGGNVELSTHAPETGGSWVKHPSYSDSLNIDDTQDWVTGVGGADFGLYYNTASPAAADYYVQADISVPSTVSATYPGVCGRINTGANTLYEAYWDPPGGAWTLRKKVGGSITSLGTFSQNLSSGVTYVLKLELGGSTIAVYIDTVSRISVVDTDIAAAGKAGVLTYAVGPGQHVTRVTAVDIGGGGGGGGGFIAPHNHMRMGVGRL